MQKSSFYRRLAVVTAAFSLWSSTPAAACTAFGIPESAGKVVAKSYDWHQGHGTVVLNQSGLQKTAMVTSFFDKAATWKSQYPSLTFNQHGREFPLGGVNSEGLVIEILWLEESKYPASDKRPTVNELQWIQYQLDQYKTVAEVEAAADTIRVAPVHAAVHYFVCDATGACGTFEYLNGKLVVHSGATLSVPTITNDTYEASATYLKGFTNFGGSLPIPTDDSSLSRFVRASSLALSLTNGDEVDDAFTMLKSVGGTPYTKFHIVYSGPKVAFRTQSHTDIKKLNLVDYDLACAPGQDKTLLLDMNQAAGQAPVAYTKAQNRAMIDEALKDIDPSKLPPGAADRLASYPDKQKCQ